MSVNDATDATDYSLQGIPEMYHKVPKYGCKGTVKTCFALIALVAWKYWFDSTLRKLSVHPKDD